MMKWERFFKILVFLMISGCSELVLGRIQCLNYMLWTNWYWQDFHTFWEVRSKCTASELNRETGSEHSLGLFPRFMQQLFKKIETSSSPSVYQTGISCWDIHRNDVIDLLANQNLHNNQNAVVYRVSTYSQLTQVMQMARSRSSNWAKSG